MNGLTFLELDYEINILKDSESLSLSVHLSFVISINHRIFVHLKRTVYNLKSATTRLYDTEAKIICIVSKKGAQCIECHHKDI